MRTILAIKSQSPKKRVNKSQTLQNNKRKRVRVRSIVDQNFTTPYLVRKVRTKRMLKMATRKSVGTETPIKSQDKKMRTKRTRKRRTKEVWKVRIRALRVDKDRKRRARAGRKISGT